MGWLSYKSSYLEVYKEPSRMWVRMRRDSAEHARTRKTAPSRCKENAECEAIAPASAS